MVEIGREIDGDIVEIEPVDRLVTTQEAAERLGVRPNTLMSWRHRYPTFPKPIGRLHKQYVWSWAQLVWWFTLTPDERRGGE
jgi:hypothetical protein